VGITRDHMAGNGILRRGLGQLAELAPPGGNIMCSCLGGLVRLPYHLSAKAKAIKSQKQSQAIAHMLAASSVSLSKVK
jgi:hypothetical protein